MTKKLAFDTLSYAKMLESGGVKHPDVHSASLASVITQNIYVKDEVDKMIRETFRRFDERTRELARKADADRTSVEKRFNINHASYEKRFTADCAYHEKEALKLENRLERAINRSMYTTIGVLGGLTVLVGGLVGFLHKFT